MKPWITTTALAANTAAIAFLIWMQFQDKETESMKAIEEQLRINNNKIEENRSTIIQELQTIKNNADTVQIIRENIKNNETVYYRDMGYLLQLDSSERANEYRDKLYESWKHFKDGSRVYFPGQLAK